MEIAFRIECPHCRWGYPWSNALVNQGWTCLRCHHCGRMFHVKISVPVVSVEVQAAEPNAPISCHLSVTE